MDEYRVIKFFTDLQDNNYAYNAGDTFPRKGLKVSAARFSELSSSNNRQHKPLIERIEAEEIKKPKAPSKRKRKSKNDAN